MDKRVIYRLHGYIEYIPLQTGFITPVFYLEHDLYIQVGDDEGIIVSFEKIPHEKTMVHANPLHFDIGRSESDPCLYGFKFNEDEIYYDECLDLSQYIEERLASYKNNEYLLQSVSSFSEYSKERKKVQFKPDFIWGGQAILYECQKLILKQSYFRRDFPLSTHRELINFKSLFVIEKPTLEKVKPLSFSIIWNVLSTISFGMMRADSKPRSLEHYRRLLDQITDIDFKLPKTLEVKPESAVNVVVEMLGEKRDKFWKACEYYNNYRTELTVEHQQYVYDRLQNFLSMQDINLILVENYLIKAVLLSRADNPPVKQSINKQLTENLNQLTERLDKAFEYRDQYEKERNNLIQLLMIAPSPKSRKRYDAELQSLNKYIEDVENQIKQLVEWIKELTHSINDPSQYPPYKY